MTTYKSKMTAPIEAEYKEWMKKNYPGDYYDKYGGKKPYNRLSNIGKISRIGGYGTLAGIVYELGKYVLDVEGDIPNDLEEREQIRMQMIMNNVPKVVTNKDGSTSVSLPNKQDLKDHLPYKKYLSDKPDLPGSAEVEGVDFEWVDPYEEMYGAYDESQKKGYELTELGWRPKPESSTITKIGAAVDAVSSVIPPEIKDVAKKTTAFVTGGAFGLDKK